MKNVTLTLTAKEATMLYECAVFGSDDFVETGSDPYGGFTVTRHDENALNRSLVKLARAAKLREAA